MKYNKTWKLRKAIKGAYLIYMYNLNSSSEKIINELMMFNPFIEKIIAERILRRVAAGYIRYL